MSCKCRICGRPCDCGELLCPICDVDYGDEVYHCSDGHCDVDLQKIAQRIRRAREQRNAIDKSSPTS